ncbi:transporter substrate-binding domain-containing protein [Sciscionella sediminilitoris]|uniref:transporter substrate-binding domain-containing protein n=1 Tax=Sciscionella sediminilitoris TaxID=1445613 RepID=UPI0004DEF292|nr:transporter substrate-binding domain-containing protein [Sciscionella sp. SE31]
MVSSRRSLAALLAAMLGLGACSGAVNSRYDKASGGDPAAVRAVLDAAPVAGPGALDRSTAALAIHRKGTVAIGAGYDVPLYSMKNPMTGEYTGFDASLAKMLAKYLTGRTDVQWVNVTSDTREALLENGTTDFTVATYQITPQRARLVDFAGPYLIGGGAILVRADNTSVHGLADLNGVTTATMPAVAAEALQQQQPGAQQVIFDSASQCLQALRQGRVDAFFLNSAILSGFVLKHDDVKFAGPPTRDAPFGIGMSKQDPQLKRVVDDWLRRIYADGSWARLWRATIGTVERHEPPKPPVLGSVPGS